MQQIWLPVTNPRDKPRGAGYAADSRTVIEPRRLLKTEHPSHARRQTAKTRPPLAEIHGARSAFAFERWPRRRCRSSAAPARWTIPAAPIAVRLAVRSPNWRQRRHRLAV